MDFWSRIEKLIISMNELGGRIGWVIILYLMSFGLYDVIMRYLFDNPSLWIWETLQFGMVTLACVAGGYAFLHGHFVKLDVFYMHFSPRLKALLDIVTFCFTLLYCSVLIWKGIEFAHMAWIIRERTPSAIPLPLYPLKSLIPVAAFILLLAAVRKFIYDIKIIRQGR